MNKNEITAQFVDITQAGVTYPINVEQYSFKDILPFANKGWLLIDDKYYVIIKNDLLLTEDGEMYEGEIDVEAKYLFVRKPNMIDMLLKRLSDASNPSKSTEELT